MRTIAQAVVILLTACPAPQPVETDTTTDDTDIVEDTSGCSVGPNWTTVGAPFVYTWCTPCHAPELTTLDERQEAPLAVNLGSYDDVVEWETLISARVFDEADPMPPAGGPSNEELDAVAHWIGCGMPE